MGRLIVAVSQNAVVEAESAIHGCDQCRAEATVPFWQVLDTLRNHQGMDATYLLPILACCPNCRGRIDEMTLVEPKVKRSVGRLNRLARSADL